MSASERYVAPKAKAPALRKPRRVMPSQYFVFCPKIVNMAGIPFSGEAGGGRQSRGGFAWRRPRKRAAPPREPNNLNGRWRGAASQGVTCENARTRRDVAPVTPIGHLAATK